MERNHFACCTNELRRQFCFSGKCHDEFYDLGEDSQDWAVSKWDGDIFCKKNACADVAAQLGFAEEAGVRVCGKNHVSSDGVDSAICGISGNIVKELVNGGEHVDSGGCLLCTQCTESHQELVVKSSCIVE